MDEFFHMPEGILQAIMRQDLVTEPTIEEQARAIALPEGSSEPSYQTWRRPMELGLPPWLCKLIGDKTKDNSWFNWNHYHIFGPEGKNIGYAKPGRIKETLGPGWSTDTPQFGNYRFPARLIEEAEKGYEHGQYFLPWNNCQHAVKNIVKRAREIERQQRLILLVPGMEPYIMR